MASSISAVISCSFRSRLAKIPISCKAKVTYDVKQQNVVFLKINVRIGLIKAMIAIVFHV